MTKEMKDLIKFIDEWCDKRDVQFKDWKQGDKVPANKLVDAIKERFQQEDYSPVPSYMKHGVNLLNSMIAKKRKDELE